MNKFFKTLTFFVLLHVSLLWSNNSLSNASIPSDLSQEVKRIIKNRDVPSLIKVLKNSKEKIIRREALIALSFIKDDPRILQTLVRIVLNDGNYEIKALAIKAVAQYDSHWRLKRVDVPSLIRELENPNMIIQKEIEIFLRRLFSKSGLKDDPRLRKIIEELDNKRVSASGGNKADESINIRRIDKDSNLSKVSPALLLNFSCQIKGKKENVVLNAGEATEMNVTIMNKGKEKAENVEIQVFGFSSQDITMEEYNKIEVIHPDQIINVNFSIKVNARVSDHIVPLRIHVNKVKGVEPLIQEFNITLLSRETDLYLGYKGQKDINKAVEVARTYISEYENGKYSAEMKKVLIFDINSDTYRGYTHFIEENPNHKFTSLAKKRTTLKHWMQREKMETENSRIMCQVAQALVVEKGSLGYSEARERYEKVINIEEDDWNDNIQQAYMGIGKILNKQGKYFECAERLGGVYKMIKDLQRSNKEDLKAYNFLKIFYYLGCANERLRKKNEAIKYYSDAIKGKYEIYEKDVYLDCLYSRGVLYYEIPSHEKAKDDFKKIIELAPNTHQAEKANEYLRKMR